MIPKLAELFASWFRKELYGSEDRLAELIKQYGVQHTELTVEEGEAYDFAGMFATLENRIVERVVAEMGKQSIRIVGSRKKVSAPVETDTQPDEG